LRDAENRRRLRRIHHKPEGQMNKASAIILSLCAFPAIAAADDVACQKLTDAEVSAALAITVNPGAPIAKPTSCQWMGKGRFATLTINQDKNGKTPLAQFAAGKASALPGITAEPVSGVGDDAYYVYFGGQDHTGMGLVVKKGTQVFEVRVYGYTIAEGKGVAKTLAQHAAARF
jgi:hypothetical protein